MHYIAGVSFNKISAQKVSLFGVQAVKYVNYVHQHHPSSQDTLVLNQHSVTYVCAVARTKSRWLCWFGPAKSLTKLLNRQKLLSNKQLNHLILHYKPLQTIRKDNSTKTSQRIYYILRVLQYGARRKVFRL